MHHGLISTDLKSITQILAVMDSTMCYHYIPKIVGHKRELNNLNQKQKVLGVKKNYKI